MILTTTPNVEGREIAEYKGIVSGDAILGANIFRDALASIRDIIGGRSASYERELRHAKELALSEMQQGAEGLGANAVVGVDLDFETVGDSMLMVSASGTAVLLS